MWLIELNVAGHRFTHKWPDKRRELFTWSGRTPWRAMHLRQSRAA
jgi:hypothetical protein